MNGFGFGNFNSSSNENTLAQLLKPYLQQPEPTQPLSEPQRTGYSGIKVYEIPSNDKLTYIKPDDTGQKQIILCEPEKTIYIARYNYATGKPDYEKYISEGNIELFKKNDTTAEMSQIAEALVAVANKLEAMRDEIQELKNIAPVIVEPKKEESNRKANGQFKRKGES